MEYIFIPGRSTYDKWLKEYFRERPNSELIVTAQTTPGSTSRERVRRIDQAVKCITTNTDITRPVDQFYICAHGNDNGFMKIQMANIDLDNNGTPDYANFEVATAADNSNVCNIPNGTLATNANVRIRGCNIGQDFALPFLQKFKSALGITQSLSAPKHFHYISKIPSAGWFETFLYQFQLSRKDRFTGSSARNDLIAAFQGESLDFIQPTNFILRDDFWDKWLPRRVGLGKRRTRYPVRFDPPIKPRRGSDIVTQRLTISTGFRAERKRFTYTAPNINDPGSRQARIDAALDGMRNHQAFKSPPQNPYPLHKRYEFDTVNDFLDGHNWEPSYNSDTRTLVCVGTRYLYSLLVPVCLNPEYDPALIDATHNKIIYNFAPRDNNPNPATTGINESDTDIFQIV